MAIVIFAREPLIAWSSHWTYIMFGCLVLAIILGTWSGAVAAGKGRSMQKWFLIGFFLPIIGLAASYIVKPSDTSKPVKKPAEPDKK